MTAYRTAATVEQEKKPMNEHEAQALIWKRVVTCLAVCVTIGIVGGTLSSVIESRAKVDIAKNTRDEAKEKAAAAMFETMRTAQQTKAEK